MEIFEKEPAQAKAIAKETTKSTEQTGETGPGVMPQSLRYIMCGLLVLGIAGAVVFAFVRQLPAKTVAVNADGQTCADPVTENRLRETVSRSPNDFSTLMEWGDYNRRCREPADYASAISAFQNAVRLAENPANQIPVDSRTEAHLNLGLAYLFNKSFKEAQSEFRFILNENPNNTSALLALGATLVKDDPPQALTYLRKVVDMSPPDSAIAQNAQVLINDINKSGAKISPTPKS